MNKAELKQNGFVPIPETQLMHWINSAGVVYDIEKDTTTTPRTIYTNQLGQTKPEKVILWAFKNEKPRHGQIIHINGNKTDKSPENLKYSQLHSNPPERLDKEALKSVLRCYFEIDKNARPTMQHPTTKIYLSLILHQRGQNIPEMTQKYIEGETVANLALKYGLSIRDTSNNINSFFNQLFADILKDKNAGLLFELPYLQTERERRKQVNNFLKQLGLTKITTEKELRKEAIKLISDTLNNKTAEILAELEKENTKEAQKSAAELRQQMNDFLKNLA